MVPEVEAHKGWRLVSPPLEQAIASSCGGRILSATWRKLKDGLRGLRCEHYVEVGGLCYVPQVVEKPHSMSGNPLAPVGQHLSIVIGKRGTRAATARRARAKKRRMEARQELMLEALAGDEEDDLGRWAVSEVLDVRRPARRRGRALEVQVRWEGDWDDSWISVTLLTADMRKVSRSVEARKYAHVGVPPQAAQRRAATRERQGAQRAIAVARARGRNGKRARDVEDEQAGERVSARTRSKRAHGPRAGDECTDAVT